MASKENALYLASLATLEQGLVKHKKMQSNSDILTELTNAEQDEQAQPPIHLDASTLNKQKYFSALSYVVRHTLTPKRIAVIAAAAVLLLGVVLTAVILSGPDKVEPLVNQEPLNNAPDAAARPIVATLTATHNAQWSHLVERALANGSQLHAGDRLILTGGFAEITTNRGAVAILEAPATVELLDNDNALRLHSGKLVGICETESSKGFLVRTANMDVIDLGTVFGVEANDDQVVATVFSGAIDVAPATGSPKRLAVNQTARISRSDQRQELVIEQESAEGFTRHMPDPALVTAAYINDERFTVAVVAGGFHEDAKIHTDRLHQVNGVDEQGLPAILIGGDIIQTPADARPRFHDNTDTLKIEADFASQAQIYVITRASGPGRDYPDWLLREYTKTEMQIGLDQGPFSINLNRELAVGPGQSIDEVLEVWRRNHPASGRITIGRHMTLHIPYIIVAVPTQ